MKSFFIFVAAWLVLAACSVRSCDLCACHVVRGSGQKSDRFVVSVSERFTHFGTMQRDGVRVPDPAVQYLESMNTQFVLGYQVVEKFRLQLNVPWINRIYRRPENFSFDSGVDADGDGETDIISGTNMAHGSESGLGNVSVLGNWVAYEKKEGSFQFSWNVLGGCKFPTGNTAWIGEELDETEVDGAPDSGIHGHDLALGSGSFDGIVGTVISLNWERLFFDAETQYTIRTEGDLSYRYANDLIWRGGPGFYTLKGGDGSLGIQAVVSGESKGRDRFRGNRADDTGITAVYLGPRIVGSWSERLDADLGLDLPVSMENTALQLVPDYRVHAAITWRF